MGANLPLCRALERVFNMTIKCLSFRFYSILLSLSWELLQPRSSFFPPLSFSSSDLSVFAALHLYSAAFAQIKLRLFSISEHLLMFYDTHYVNFMSLLIFFPPLFLLPSCLNRHKPFCLLLTVPSHSCFVGTLYDQGREKTFYGGGGCVCLFVPFEKVN